MSSSVELAIVPVSLQALLYGLYLATLFHCLRWLIFDGRNWNTRRHINWPMLSFTIIVFALSTIDLVLELRMAIGAVLQLDVVEYRKQVLVARVVANAVRLIFDAALVYRCWVVHAKSWRVNLPAVILWLSCLASFIAIVYYNRTLSHMHMQPNSTITSRLQTVLLLFYSCNIATVIYATAAIIRHISHNISDDYTNTTSILCHMIAGSGFLYTLTSPLLLVSTAIEADFDYELDIFRVISGAINFSLAGISFNLILLQFGQSSSEPIISHSVVQSSHIMSSLQFYVSHYPSEERVVALADEEEGTASKK